MSRREKPSYIPLFPDSYLADTTHLTTEQHGAYVLLLMAAWRSADCTLPHDEVRLAKLAGLPLARWRKVGPTILEMWTCEGGRCRQKRLSHEWDYVQKKRGLARAAVAIREQRKGAFGASSDVSSDEHQGGGEGEGGTSQSHYHEQKLGEGTRARDGLTVIAGGAK